MHTDKLLEVGPEELAITLLERRKMLKDSLPGVIRNLEAEEESLAPKLERLEKSFKKANEKVAKLKAIRDSSQQDAGRILTDVKGLREIISESGGLISLDPKWKKEKLFEKIDQIELQIQTSALDHKSEREMLNVRRKLMQENERWLQERRDSNPEMAQYIERRREMSILYKEADKSHRSMIKAVEKAQPIFEKRSSLASELKEIKSQLDRARELLSQSDRAIEHWEKRLSRGFAELGAGFPDLLGASKRVSEGGKSSFAKKTRSHKKKKLPKRGEEE